LVEPTAYVAVHATSRKIGAAFTHQVGYIVGALSFVGGTCVRRKLIAQWLQQDEASGQTDFALLVGGVKGNDPSQGVIATAK